MRSDVRVARPRTFIPDRRLADLRAYLDRIRAEGFRKADRVRHDRAKPGPGVNGPLPLAPP